MIQKVLYNVTGQTLYLDVPEGRPSSVTSVSVFPRFTGDDGTAESATTGSASVETNPNTTFDAASGAGQSDPRVLNLTATTGMSIGRRYLATNATGEKEWVEIVAISSGASATARYDLRNAYAASDTLEGTRISISVDSTWVADQTNISDDMDPNPGYRVRWEYVVSSVTYVQDTYFDLVRYEADHTVRPQDVAEERFGWIHSLPTEHQEDQGRRLIDAAYQGVAFDLHKIGIADEMLRNRDVVDRLTIWRAILNQSREIAVQSGNTTPYEIDRDEYQSLLDSLVKVTNRTDMAVSSDGAPAARQAVSLWER